MFQKKLKGLICFTGQTLKAYLHLFPKLINKPCTKEYNKNYNIFAIKIKINQESCQWSFL